MQDNRDAAFAAWVEAEDAAHSAIHRLHQLTRGGRTKAASTQIEGIARLRKEADVLFAALWGGLGAVAMRPEAAVQQQEPIHHAPRPQRPQRIVMAPRPALALPSPAA